MNGITENSKDLLEAIKNKDNPLTKVLNPTTIEFKITAIASAILITGAIITAVFFFPPIAVPVIVIGLMNFSALMIYAIAVTHLINESPTGLTKEFCEQTCQKELPTKELQSFMQVPNIDQKKLQALMKSLSQHNRSTNLYDNNEKDILFLSNPSPITYQSLVHYHNELHIKSCEYFEDTGLDVSCIALLFTDEKSKNQFDAAVKNGLLHKLTNSEEELTEDQLKSSLNRNVLPMMPEKPD